MNYMLFMCKTAVMNWYEGARRGCTVCIDEFNDFSDYMIENHIIM